MDTASSFPIQRRRGSLDGQTSIDHEVSGRTGYQYIVGLDGVEGDVSLLAFIDIYSNSY